MIGILRVLGYDYDGAWEAYDALMHEINRTYVFIDPEMLPKPGQDPT